MNIGIYKITSPSGKVYVGQSINIRNRKYHHKSKTDKQKGPKLYRSIMKYGWENHVFEIIEEGVIGKLDERETYWKQYYLDLVNGDWSKVLFCDLHDRGGGPRSEETKQKISKSNIGRIVSIDTREKKRISMLGKTASLNTKEKMRQASIGKTKSNQHKINMMLNRNNVIKGIKLANSKPINQYDLEGNFIKEWESIIEAKKYIGKGDIYSCCNNRQKTAGGFIWKFKNK
jgi:group I intron endonuclease